MGRKNFMWAALALLVLGLLSGCAGTSTTTQQVQPQNFGAVAVFGSDAPMANVVAFQASVTGLTLSDGSTTVNLLSAPQTIEFSQLNGLTTLLDINSVPTGTYSSITVTLSSPVLTILDTTQSPPVITTMPGSLTQSSVTKKLRQPLMVDSTGIVGLLFDLNLDQSIQVDANGQVTGAVNPQVSLQALIPGTDELKIDDLRGGVVSVDTSTGSFVIQGAGGRQFTIQTDDKTTFTEGDSLSSLNSNTIVGVSGTLDQATRAIHAIDVDVESQNHFLIAGLITNVRPSSGPANQVDLLVRAVVPDLSGVTVGQIFTVNLTGNEKFLIRRKEILTGNFAFGPSSLVAGQSVAVGGSLDTSMNPPTMTPQRVVLQAAGFVGDWVPGSTTSTAFSFNVDSIAGALFGQAVTVRTAPSTHFLGLSGLTDLSGTQPIRLRVIGFVLLDHSTGQPVIFARVVARFPPPSR